MGRRTISNCFGILPDNNDNHDVDENDNNNGNDYENQLREELQILENLICEMR